MGQGFCAKSRQFLLTFCQLGALAYTLFAFCPGRGALLFDRENATLKIGMKPIDALEGSLGAAPPLLEAGEFSGDMRRFLLQAFTLLAQGRQARLLLFKG
jgi:hypothetical protein